jgi:twitching motility protein PilJ
MKSEIEQSNDYKLAEKAYLQGNYEEAAQAIDQLVKLQPSDPHVRLLRGHIYCYGLQHYDVACREYQTVLDLTSDPDFVEYAGNGLAYANQFLDQESGDSMTTDIDAASRKINLNMDDWISASTGFGNESGLFSEDSGYSDASGGAANHDGSDLTAFTFSNPLKNAQPESNSGIFFGGSDVLPDPFDTADQHSSSDSSDYSFGDSLAEPQTDDPYGPESTMIQSDSLQFASSAENLNSPLQNTPLPQTEISFDMPFDPNGFNFSSSESENADLLAVNPSQDIGAPDPSDPLTNFDLRSLSGIDDEEEHSQLIVNDFSEARLASSLTGIGISEKTVQSSSPLRGFEAAPFSRKQSMTALTTGAVAAVIVMLGTGVTNPGGKGLNMGTVLTALAAGLGSGTVAFVMNGLSNRHMKRSANQLRTQFELAAQGNWDAQAAVTSKGELGQLGASFNQLMSGFKTSIAALENKVAEQERQKEDLQRQVIRLLDDVEGAARGDLTVQAEVTADVLGAVADSFNLTIQNLREIVVQVKEAARQVNMGSGESESFARSLSSDALEQAEQLAATLQSVQMMTDSIQRVAVNAREAEQVAQLASETAARGGEAVERTVSGILDIRETVAETTRKVKRLAESSQEISKIVALISQIASRTNLLALNASIEAARAGESGRGFAIVADEVRQLADRAAKASKEIEQIVLQIQSDTGSVMTAMEEGTQQVIQGTRLAEQAKRSLDDIIQVSTKIDGLVRSITANTEEQNETSRSVAQVMQSVELTAQETSQEAQKVSASLQNLVGVSRSLLTSVERFRVESTS